MTEQEWLDCSEPSRMLEMIHPTASDRKLWLFACACSRLVWHLLEHDWSRDALIAVERYLEGNLTRFESLVTREMWNDGIRAWGTKQEAMLDSRLAQRDRVIVGSAVCTLLWAMQTLVPEAEDESGDSLRKPVLAVELSMVHAAKALALASGEVDRFPDRLIANGVPIAAAQLVEPLRDIFNPFRPVTIASGSLTPTLVSLAYTAYEERIMPSGYLDLNRLAGLSKALEEAGWDAAILAHLRNDEMHVRGCWLRFVDCQHPP